MREYVQAGVAALHLEDQVSPKCCGQLAGIRLMEAEDSALRLQAAVAARGDDDLLIIGRTDALPAQGIEAAIERARRYADTGIDLPRFIHEGGWVSGFRVGSSGVAGCG